MQSMPILPQTLETRISALEKELERLEHVHNLDSAEVYATKTGQNLVRGVRVGTSAIWQYHYSLWIRGNTLTLNAEAQVGYIPNWCDYELRYYQQLPSIYTPAQLADHDNQSFIVITSGRVNGIDTAPAWGTPQAISNVVDLSPLDIQGTYGRLELWLDCSADGFGERSYFVLFDVTIE